MKPVLPYGAAEILALREIGKRPADMLLVSLIGPLREVNPVVVANPLRRYAWHFVVGLPVLVVGDSGIDRAAVNRVLNALLAERPDSLSLWFADRQDGFNVVIEGYKPVSDAGHRMSLRQRVDYAGLGSEKSRAECLREIADQTRQEAMRHVERLDAALVELAQRGFQDLFGKAWA